MIKTLFLKRVLVFIIVGLTWSKLVGQTTIVNYDFNSGISYATLSPALSTGITAVISSTEPFATATGIASGPVAFVANSTAGVTILMSNSSGNNTRYYQFQMSGPALSNYSNYKVYCQSRQSGTGAMIITLAYSIDGTTFTNLPMTGSPGNGSFTETVFDLSSITTLNYQPIIYFRILASGASGSGTLRIDNFQLQAQALPKYYKSLSSGDWSSPSTWQSSTNGITWNNATLSPASTDYAINVQSGHNVTVSSSVSLDETTIYGTLNIITGGIMTVNDGTGDDVTIQNNGILQASSTSNYSATISQGTSVINILTGGKIEIGDGTALVIGTGYEAFATNTNNKWQDASTFEWNSTTTFQFGTNITYFQNPGLGIPIFLITKITPSPIIGTAATVNGLLMVNSILNLSTTGDKTFRDGISGNSILTLDAGAGGRYLLTSTNAILGGTVTINLNKDLTLTSGITIPAGASVTINGSSANIISKGSSGIFLVNGIVDMKSTHLTNTSGSVTVNGTLKTSSAQGFYGTGTATLTNGSVILNNNSTIEYNASGAQDIQAPVMQLPQYFNVTFSGSGIKTPSNPFIPTGTLTITGNAILDATHNIGDGVAGTTNFTMDGGRLILRTTTPTTQPQMNGLYNLTGGIVEFTGSNATTQAIRSLKNYYAIEVTGTNVGNSSGNINLNPNGTFTVKNGGVFMINADAIDGMPGTQTVTVESGGLFRCGNNEGFNGFVSTISNYSSLHQNIENINLMPGSTVEYMRAGDQPITNANGLVYQNLLLSGSGNKTAPSGILTVQGNLSKSGTSVFVPNGGTVLLNGVSAQSFAGLTYNNLILNNNTKTTQGNSTILDSLKVNTATTLTISSTDTVFIHSDAAKTGRVAQVDGTISNSGNFTVERYIPAKRAWRFLAVPTTSSVQTIKSAWQEGALNLSSDLHPGYGTQLQTNNANWSTNGFDAQSINGPSIKAYNSTTDTYTGVTSTLNPFDVTLGGYMTFIRGDRTATYFGAPVTKTVLRTTGNLFTGNQPAISVLHGKIIPVNNPYASPIDLRKLSSSYNVFYYVWDPNRGGIYGLGAIQTFSWNGTNYDVVPGTGSYGTTNNFIESGQAFFVSTLGLDTTVQITEAAKVSTAPASIPFVPVVNPSQLHINLYTVNSDGSTVILDGILTSYANNYTNSVDGMDAKKLLNASENLSVKSNNQLLIVERRTTIVAADTLFLELTGTGAKQYRFELIADNLNQPGLKAYLEDSYLNNRTSIDITGNTIADFTIDPADINSSKADRFRIVFEAPAAGPLPLTITNVKAYQKNENIAVEWSTLNETNLKQYDVEKSTNGNSFKYGTTVKANNTPSNVYTWLDENALEGYNYYRIKTVNDNNETKYSQVVKVFMPERKQLITVYPNPIKNGIINLKLINQPAGIYSLKLTDNLGQVILLKEITHSIGTSTEVVSIVKEVAHGYYNLEITKPGAGKISQKILY